MGAKRRKIEVVATQYQCRHCAHSYDWHSKALDGHLILCRCPYKMEGGKYCIFLSDPTCEHFKLRIDDGKEEESAE